MISVGTALAITREVAACILAPRAQATDLADGPPIENVRALGRTGLLGFTTPARFGGIGASGADLRRFTEELASTCGVTTFVQGQHQSAALLIAGSENEALKKGLLPSMATGDTMCGVAFSHLRRKGPPALKAAEESDCFVFDGVAPWITGWGIMGEVVLGGTLQDGRFLYVVASLQDNPAMEISPPMRLCAMNASGTVSVKYRGFRVPRERILKIITPIQIAENDDAAILGVTAQPIGVSRAAISLIKVFGEERENSDFVAAATALEETLDNLRVEVDQWAPRIEVPGFRERALDIRARAISHGVRCAHAALAAAGGRGNSLDHPAQRLFREAMFYTLTAQTPDVQSATLRNLRHTLDSSVD